MECELHRILDPIAAAPVPARRPAPGGSSNPAKKLLGGAGAALGLKALTGFAIAAMAAGAATGAAITGSFNPADWGHQVRHQVTTTTDQQGAAAGDQHATSTAPANGSSSSSTVNASAPVNGTSVNGTPVNGTPVKNVSPDNGPNKGKLPVRIEPEPADPGMQHGPMPIGPET